MRLFTLAATISFAVCRCCGCFGFWIGGVTVGVVATLFMGVSSLALAVAFHAMRGMYLHAERLLAKAGGSNCKGRGISHPWNEAIARVERAERSGGLHKRSAEAWGHPCGREGRSS